MNLIEAQRTLFRLGFDPKGCDGIMGPNTAAAIEAYQKFLGFDATGFLDTDTVGGLSQALYTLPPLILARNFTPASRPTSASIDLIVIHTMQAPEKPGTARNVAQWFAGPSAPKASAHYCVDDQDTIQCVLECDVAWGAPGANRNGIHIEHAGYAAQSPVDWSDTYSRAMLDRSAHLAARLAARFDIPVRRVSADALKVPGEAGFCGHVDVTMGLCDGKGHMDPGPSFPWDDYLKLVESYT